MALVTNIAGRIRTTLTGTADHGTPRFDGELDCGLRLEDGSGANQASRAWHDQRSLGASAAEELDLSGGLVDEFGYAIVFTAIKALMVRAAAGNTNDVVVGGASAYAFLGPFAESADKLVLPPGGFVLLVHPDAGWTVTSSPGDLLRIANGGAGTAVTYDIVLVGID